MGHREGKEDARKSQTAGSLLRKGHWQKWFGSIWTLEGDDPGDWGTWSSIIFGQFKELSRESQAPEDCGEGREAGGGQGSL